MIHPDYISADTSRRRVLCGALLLLCLCLTHTPAAFGQHAEPSPAAAQAPADAPAPPPTQSSPVVQVGTPPRAPRTPTAALAPAAAQRAPSQVPAPRRPTGPAPAPPREVVTVVHRLSGWKLLTWLAANGPPALELHDLPSLTDAHTKIVAGYVYVDGRTVVARLPQAEAEFESPQMPPVLPALLGPTAGTRDSEPEYLLVTTDGRRVEAKFVGVDSSTGLTLLEAKEGLLPGAPAGDEGDTDDPAVGQHVRLYAPAPVGVPPHVARGTSQAEAGSIYLSIDQREGLLTEVRRAPSGKPSHVVVGTSVSPEWAGAVAVNDLGEVVGIVSQSRDGETQVVPMAAVVSACERVLRLRGSAPQPWLGARGDAAFQSPLAAWLSRGWTPELALPHIEKRQGVFLTSVAPGTPAELAGLKAGDLIARVGARDVRSVEDLSQTLLEAGVGSTVDLTVWRALEPAPLRVSVELKGANNPALATAEAEERALRAAFVASRRELGEISAAAGRLKSAPVRDARELEGLTARLAAAEERLLRLSEQLELTRAKANAARTFSVGTARQMPLLPGGVYAAAMRLQAYGLNAIGLSPRSAARLGAKGGLLVVAVRPGSPAAAGGVAAGDVIETLNGLPFTRDLLRAPLLAPEPPAQTLGLVREGRRLTVSLSPQR